MSKTTRETYAADYFLYLQKRSAFRKWLRQWYLRDIAKYCKGRTIDFGCGIGELLKILPDESIGFEVNPFAVAFGKKAGLDILLYTPEVDLYRLRMVPEGLYHSFTMNHVLEHIEGAGQILSQIMNSCARLGINRIVLTVPGIRGYASDHTHRTFVDLDYLHAEQVLNHPRFKLSRWKYFPFNHWMIGTYFTHNELRLIFDARKS